MLISTLIDPLLTLTQNMEKLRNITIKRGKIHKYPRTTINYSSTVKVLLSMVNYIVKMFNEILEDKRGGSVTPSAHHIFDILEDVTKPS